MMLLVYIFSWLIDGFHLNRNFRKSSEIRHLFFGVFDVRPKNVFNYSRPTNAGSIPPKSYKPVRKFRSTAINLNHCAYLPLDSSTVTPFMQKISYFHGWLSIIISWCHFYLDIIHKNIIWQSKSFGKSTLLIIILRKKNLILYLSLAQKNLCANCQ